MDADVFAEARVALDALADDDLAACDRDGLRPWDRAGRTDLDNLLPLCSQHHHLVHEGGWGLRLDAHRVVTLERPDGTIHYSGSTIDRTPPIVRPGAPPGTQRTAA